MIRQSAEFGPGLPARPGHDPALRTRHELLCAAATAAFGGLAGLLSGSGALALGGLALALAQLALLRASRGRLRTGGEERATLHRLSTARDGEAALLSDLSHEIRAPMQEIVEKAELLLETELSHGQRERATGIRGSARGLFAILNDLLDFSALETGALRLEERPFDLRRCLEKVVELSLPRSTSKGLELLHLVHPDVPENVIGDRERIEQILAKLVENSVHSTHEGRVEVEVELLSRQGERVEVEFRVADTGPGVPAEEPLRPLRAVRPRGGSTGLGMAISSELARRMGGELGVESKAGRGSSAWLRVSLGSAEVPGQAAADGAPLRGKRLLVVDGSSAARRVARIYAEHSGIEVHELSDPGSVVAELRSAQQAGRPYDVVLLADRLPGLAGKELACRIRDELALARPRLILVSTPDPSDHPSHLARSGLDAWIKKPIRESALRTALVYVTEGPDTSAGGLDRTLPRERALPIRAGHRVLFAEDNLIHKRVAALLLKQLGCDVTIVDNGLAAIEALRRESFSIVFMDCQMPMMSGFQATQAIRELESEERRSVPIIAMTTHATMEERERCLSAGMNDHLPKPVQIGGLRKMLDRWVGPWESVRGKSSEVDDMQEGREGVLDGEVIASLRGLSGEGEPDLFTELVHLFLEDTPHRLQELHRALDGEDHGALERAAHALKSSTANLGALSLSKLFREIESAGRSHDLERATSLVRESRDEYQRVEDALRSEIAS